MDIEEIKQGKTTPNPILTDKRIERINKLNSERLKYEKLVRMYSSLITGLTEKRENMKGDLFIAIGKGSERREAENYNAIVFSREFSSENPTTKRGELQQLEESVLTHSFEDLRAIAELRLQSIERELREELLNDLIGDKDLFNYVLSKVESR